MLMTSCSAATVDEDTGFEEQHWDSEEGNPTHATHSTMAEIAVKVNRAALPEVAEYKKQIEEGANLELHELSLRGKKSEDFEALRIEVGGNNWAADRPEILWSKAKTSYLAGDKAQAYVYVGIMLHYVQDMGVPAHAFHVIHQSNAMNWDHLEVLGFFDFHADMSTPPSTPDPNLEDPIQYIEWSGQMARDHFRTSYPGAEYSRTFFPRLYSEMTAEHWKFLRRREADCVWATSYALRSAARALAAL